MASHLLGDLTGLPVVAIAAVVGVGMMGVTAALVTGKQSRPTHHPSPDLSIHTAELMRQ